MGLFAGADVLTQVLLGYPVYQMPLQFGVLRALPLFLLGVALARAAASRPCPAPLAMAGTLGAFAAIVASSSRGDKHDYLTRGGHRA